MLEFCAAFAPQVFRQKDPLLIWRTTSPTRVSVAHGVAWLIISSTVVLAEFDRLGQLLIRQRRTLHLITSRLLCSRCAPGTDSPDLSASLMVGLSGANSIFSLT